MAIVPRLKYASGKLACYTIDTASPNDNPLTSPLSNVSRLLFHSDLPMPAIVPVGGNFSTTGTTTIGAKSSINTYTSETFTLFAHGQGGTPMVFGRITEVGGSAVNISFAGSVPIMPAPGSTGSGIGAKGHFRWCHLGANDTNVILRVVTITGDSSALDTFPNSVDIDWEVFVTSYLLDNTQPTPTDEGYMLRMEPGRFTVNEGMFDSERRYMRIGSAGDMVLPDGKTIDITYSGNNGINDPGLELRYSVDGYTRQYGVSPSSYNATVTPLEF